eukprot:evm.model.scf_1646.4 EVM.evm.TU.scf_1646.4   scf_1646:32298-36220(-)
MATGTRRQRWHGDFVWLLVAWTLLSAYRARALEFDMIFQTKCVMEEIPANVLVVAEYQAFNKKERSKLVTVTTQLEGPKGDLLFNQKDTSGQFTFTTKESGEYKACFTAADPKGAQNTKLRMNWKMGVEAMNWDSVAKKENLDSLSVEMRKIDATVKSIKDQILHMRQGEEEMRNLNEATNARVAYFSVGLVIVCIALAAWQLWYLKNFFTRKKIL